MKIAFVVMASIACGIASAMAYVEIGPHTLYITMPLSGVLGWICGGYLKRNSEGTR